MCSLEEEVPTLQLGDHLWQRSVQLVAGLQTLSSKLDTITARDTHHHHHHLDIALLEAANPLSLNLIISAHFHVFL